jgi:hypothetical protein
MYAIEPAHLAVGVLPVVGPMTSKDRSHRGT